MDNLEEKKYDAFYYFSVKHLIIYSLLLLLLAICIPLMSMKRTEKAEAYTSEIQLYSGETITDLSGTSWVFNDILDNSQFASPGQSFNINFNSNNENFIELNPVNFLNRYNLQADRDNGTSVTNGVYLYQNNSWINQEYRTVEIISGEDTTSIDLINWFYQNATLQVQEYTISSNLINTSSNISLPLTITENDTISLEFTPSENNIFNTYQWNITPLNSYTLDNLVEEPFKISFDISNVTSDLTINIEAIPFINLKGQWITKTLDEVSIVDTILLNNVTFISNDEIYNSITALGGDYLSFVNSDTDLFVDVFSLIPMNDTFDALAYLPQSTYNYNLIVIPYDYYGVQFQSGVDYPSYLKNKTFFSQVYRPATASDIELINYKNAQLVEFENDYTFINLIGALIDAPITAVKGLLNFSFFGVNLFSFLTLFITLSIVYLCVKMIKGGGKDD